ncbi:MAG TPA: YdcF family protein [Rhodanobacteraceae bacterium]
MTFPIYATSPLPYAVAGVVVLALAWRSLPLGWRIGGVLAEVVLALLLTPLGAGLVVRAVAARAPPGAGCAGPAPSAIVVLAGGFAGKPKGPDDYAALQRITLQRVFAGVALWREHPQVRLVLAGGGRSSVPEAVAMANLALQLGVPGAALELETASRTTWENARNVAALTPPVPRRIWLVTSPLHMPRALVAFRAFGFQPCARPAAPEWTYRGFGPDAWVPQATAARQSANALHEWLGGIEYRVLAWRHARG